MQHRSLSILWTKLARLLLLFSVLSYLGDFIAQWQTCYLQKCFRSLAQYILVERETPNSVSNYLPSCLSKFDSPSFTQEFVLFKLSTLSCVFATCWVKDNIYSFIWAKITRLFSLWQQLRKCCAGSWKAYQLLTGVPRFIIIAVLFVCCSVSCVEFLAHNTNHWVYQYLWIRRFF